MAQIHPITLKDLEFPTVLQQIADCCITESGTSSVHKLKPFRNHHKIRKELNRVKEFTASFGSDNPIPNHGFDAIDKELQLLQIENSSVEISGFRKILTICETTADLLFFLKKNEEFYEHLSQQSSKVKYTQLISQEIHSKIDKYGLIKEDASKELAIIRRKLVHVKGQIGATFNRALAQHSQSGYLDEIRESVVDNRRVLAVMAMHRKKIHGAVLGTSRTGSIVYIEPQETFEYATELSHLEYEEDLEEKRILKQLTEYIRPYASLLKSYQKYLIKIDVLYAKAKYALSIDANLPIIREEKEVNLKNAYHPLLLASNNKVKKKTYPQSIHLNKETRIIVISGPNAGGKSITLKTVGLLQVMLQSGMLIPVDPLSEISFFKHILTDIGDNQSIENHLSTYSYRLKRMNQFLRRCDKDTLFLIDEFGTGSDPELGGALAEVFLEEFYERQSYGIITTHYSNLKIFASELPHAINANMLFDNRTLEPLFKLHLGEAGSSFTFEVAQKNGIPFRLINRAKKKVERDKIRYDRSIANLQRERHDLRKTSENLKTQEQKAAKESESLADTNLRVQEKLESYQELYDSNQKYVSLGKRFDKIAEDYFYNKRKKQLDEELLKLVLLENSKRKRMALKQKRKQEAAERKVEREVEKKLESIRKKKKEREVLEKKEEALRPKVKLILGDRVRIVDGTAVGTIDKLERGKAVVNYGMFTTKIDITELEKVY
ncbi:MAG TPA: hypothetical protein VKX30_07565 [Flavobacteriaceae bacterium]|nr:hypothetical protein [Flavobacteriaceae bacterium]